MYDIISANELPRRLDLSQRSAMSRIPAVPETPMLLDSLSGASVLLPLRKRAAYAGQDVLLVRIRQSSCLASCAHSSSAHCQRSVTLQPSPVCAGNANTLGHGGLSFWPWVRPHVASTISLDSFAHALKRRFTTHDCRRPTPRPRLRSGACRSDWDRSSAVPQHHRKGMSFTFSASRAATCTSACRRS